MLRKLLQGNVACVEGAIAAGMRFFAGYPITPSTEIAEHASRRLPQVGGSFMQMEDEIASIAAAIGASVAGVPAMTATSGPGYSLKQENLGYARYAEIPLVVVNVQRMGPSTGMPTSPSQGDYMQARWGTHGDNPVIAIAPASCQEMYDETIRAFALAETYRIPVILLADEMVGHMREGVFLHEAVPVYRKTDAPKGLPYHTDESLIPHMAPFGEGDFYHITGLAHGEDGFPTGSNAVAGALNRRILDKLKLHREDIALVDEYQTGDADTLIIAYGGTTRAAWRAVNDLRREDVAAGLFRPVTVIPFPEEELREAAEGVSQVLVVEHNDGQMLLDVQRILPDKKVDFLGRIDGGVISPKDIVKKVRYAQ
ncbi:MAG: 2-oxoacid:acceptor oxidoreductase subunit alpha [Tissierellia bacterium]|nr:2-oxoacid:acceptor oxidoreductase subunit alpha [Tissierellia bacterium]